EMKGVQGRTSWSWHPCSENGTHIADITRAYEFLPVSTECSVKLSPSSAERLPTQANPWFQADLRRAREYQPGANLRAPPEGYVRFEVSIRPEDVAVVLV